MSGSNRFIQKFKASIPVLRILSFALLIGFVPTLGLAYYEDSSQHFLPATDQLQNQRQITSTAALTQSLTNLDLVIVVDTSGSMEFDTICYGCWNRCGENSAPSSECSDVHKYLPYPKNGRVFPYDYYSIEMQTLINGNNGDPKPVTGQNHIILEAEFYAQNTSIWDPALRSPGQGYWAPQRMTYSGSRNRSSAFSIDGIGYVSSDENALSGLVRHHPPIEMLPETNQPFGHTYTLEDAENDLAPRLDYEFMPTWPVEENTYIYLRMQTYQGTIDGKPHNSLFWAVDDQPPQENTAPQGGRRRYFPPRPNHEWDWVKLDAGRIQPNVRHTLRIWAGSPGYAIDRIIITNLPDYAPLGNDPATPGSAQGLAADPCNPIFGLTVTPADCTTLNLVAPVDNLKSPLFSDWQPARGTGEAVKRLITRLDPQFEQVGLVTFNSKAYQNAQLECLQAGQTRAGVAGSGQQIYNYPLDSAIYGEYDETNCYAAKLASDTLPISYTNVLIAVEDATYRPAGATNTADGIRRALHMLGVDTADQTNMHTNDCAWRIENNWWQIGNQDQPNNQPNSGTHCARNQNTARAIIVISDGPPNRHDAAVGERCSIKLDPEPYQGFYEGNEQVSAAKECVMHYANLAARNGVPVYIIGLGPMTDVNLMQAAADVANGRFYFAPSYAQLDLITDDVLRQIRSAESRPTLPVTGAILAERLGVQLILVGAGVLVLLLGVGIHLKLRKEDIHPANIGKGENR